ncbi:MAG: hypothetical protein O6924_10645 [Alphaproteobacteria bacterium]|nr:hypothetical protein [Alphaproteobacteria bacterium]
MQFSSTPVLVAIELGFVAVLAWRSGQLARERYDVWSVYVYLTWVAAYGVVTSILGARGVYVSEDLLKWLPGLWLQLITVAVCVGPVVLFKGLRNSLRRIVDGTPWHWFAYFHGLRIAALGTAYKTITDEFPAYFEIFIGIPDLLFGLSALWMAAKAKRGAISAKSFLVWNLVGALVIVPAAPILLQLGLPGPLQLFTGLPDARAVFTFPMSIAAIVGVPLFVLINLWVAWCLWEKRRAGVGKTASFLRAS